MFLKGSFRVSEENIGLVRQILQSEGLTVEEDNDTLYVFEEVNPMEFNRTKTYSLMEKLQELGIKDCEIKAYCEVPIYHYLLQDGEFIVKCR